MDERERRQLAGKRALADFRKQKPLTKLSSNIITGAFAVSVTKPVVSAGNTTIVPSSGTTSDSSKTTTTTTTSSKVSPIGSASKNKPPTTPKPFRSGFAASIPSLLSPATSAGQSIPRNSSSNGNSGASKRTSEASSPSSTSSSGPTIVTAPQNNDIHAPSTSSIPSVSSPCLLGFDLLSNMNPLLDDGVEAAAVITSSSSSSSSAVLTSSSSCPTTTLLPLQQQFQANDQNIRSNAIDQMRVVVTAQPRQQLDESDAFLSVSPSPGGTGKGIASLFSSSSVAATPSHPPVTPVHISGNWNNNTNDNGSMKPYENLFGNSTVYLGGVALPSFVTTNTWTSGKTLPDNLSITNKETIHNNNSNNTTTNHSLLSPLHHTHASRSMSNSSSSRRADALGSMLNSSSSSVEVNNTGSSSAFTTTTTTTSTGKLQTVFANDETIRTPMHVILKRGGGCGAARRGSIDANHPITGASAYTSPFSSVSRSTENSGLLPFPLSSSIAPFSVVKKPFAGWIPVANKSFLSGGSASSSPSSTSATTTTTTMAGISMDELLWSRRQLEDVLGTLQKQLQQHPETTSASSSVEHALNAYATYSNDLLRMLNMQIQSAESMKSAELDMARNNWSAVRRVKEAATVAIQEEQAKGQQLSQEFESLIVESERNAEELDAIRLKVSTQEEEIRQLRQDKDDAVRRAESSECRCSESRILLDNAVSAMDELKASAQIHLQSSSYNNHGRGGGGGVGVGAATITITTTSGISSEMSHQVRESDTDLQSRVETAEADIADATAALDEQRAQCGILRSQVVELLSSLADRDETIAELEKKQQHMLLAAVTNGTDHNHARRHDIVSSSSSLSSVTAESSSFSPSSSSSTGYFAMASALSSPSMTTNAFSSDSSSNAASFFSPSTRDAVETLNLLRTLSTMAAAVAESAEENSSSMSTSAETQQEGQSATLTTSAATSSPIARAKQLSDTLSIRIVELTSERDGLRARCDELGAHVEALRERVAISTRAVMSGVVGLSSSKIAGGNMNHHCSSENIDPSQASGTPLKETSATTTTADERAQEMMSNTALSSSSAGIPNSGSSNNHNSKNGKILNFLFSPSNLMSPTVSSSSSSSSSSFMNMSSNNLIMTGAARSTGRKQASLYALSLDNRQLSEQVLTLQAIVDSQAREVARIAALLAATRTASSELERKLDGSRAEKELLDVKVHEYESSLVILRREKAILSSELESIKSEVDGALHQASAYQHALQASESEVNRLTLYVETLEDTVSSSSGRRSVENSHKKEYALAAATPVSSSNGIIPSPSDVAGTDMTPRLPEIHTGIALNTDGNRNTLIASSSSSFGGLSSWVQSGAAAAVVAPLNTEQPRVLRRMIVLPSGNIELEYGGINSPVTIPVSVDAATTTMTSSNQTRQLQQQQPDHTLDAAGSSNSTQVIAVSTGTGKLALNSMATSDASAQLEALAHKLRGFHTKNDDIRNKHDRASRKHAQSGGKYAPHGPTSFSSSSSFSSFPREQQLQPQQHYRTSGTRGRSSPPRASSSSRLSSQHHQEHHHSHVRSSSFDSSKNTTSSTDSRIPALLSKTEAAMAEDEMQGLPADEALLRTRDALLRMLRKQGEKHSAAAAAFPVVWNQHSSNADDTANKYYFGAHQKQNQNTASSPPTSSTLFTGIAMPQASTRGTECNSHPSAPSLVRRVDVPRVTTTTTAGIPTSSATTTATPPVFPSHYRRQLPSIGIDSRQQPQQQQPQQTHIRVPTSQLNPIGASAEEAEWLTAARQATKNAQLVTLSGGGGVNRQHPQQQQYQPMYSSSSMTVSTSPSHSQSGMGSPASFSSSGISMNSHTAREAAVIASPRASSFGLAAQAFLSSSSGMANGKNGGHDEEEEEEECCEWLPLASSRA